MRYQTALIPENPDATPGHFQTTHRDRRLSFLSPQTTQTAKWHLWIVGADLNPKVGFPKPEASVFYTEARTVLGPNWRGKIRTCNRAINSRQLCH